jgi:hypothetical protein
MKKFHFPWSGPFEITRKISDLNHEIADQNGKKQIVHVNSLKRAHNFKFWKTKPNRISVKKPPRNSPRHPRVDTEDEFRIGPFPLIRTDFQENTIEHGTPLGQNLDTPEPAQTTDTPALECSDPVYPPRHSQVKT